MGEWLFSVLFSKENSDNIFYLKVRGVSSGSSKVVWDTSIEYMVAKHFVDRLNECELPEEELLEATHDFLVEVDRLGQ